MLRQVERVQFMTANTLPYGDGWGQCDPPTTTVLLRMIRLIPQYVVYRYRRKGFAQVGLFMLYEEMPIPPGNVQRDWLQMFDDA